MLKALKRLFGISSCNRSTDKGIQSLEGFVDYVVRSFVDDPDSIRVTSESNATITTIRIDCRKEDIGKIVGKHGKTIMAIRTLVRGAAGRLNKTVNVEVND